MKISHHQSYLLDVLGGSGQPALHLNLTQTSKSALLKGQLSSSLVHHAVHEFPGAMDVKQGENEVWEEPDLYKQLKANNPETPA